VRDLVRAEVFMHVRKGVGCKEDQYNVVTSRRQRRTEEVKQDVTRGRTGRERHGCRWCDVNREGKPGRGSKREDHGPAGGERWSVVGAFAQQPMTKTSR
jgi:hypothetical protein